jgi:hypothetical protein
MVNMDSNNAVSASASARLLYDALKARNIDAILEYNDGHKTVDIAVLDAKLFIEIVDVANQSLTSLEYYPLYIFPDNNNAVFFLVA